MGKKYYILFKDSSINFPDICPVCGENATTKGTIVAPIERFKYESYVTRLNVRPKMSQLSLIQMAVPTCDRHYSSVKERGRIRSFFGVLNGILLLVFSFLFISMMLRYFSEDPVNLLQVNVSIVLGILIIIVNIILRPTALEKSVRIVEVDKGSGGMLLEVAHEWYLDALTDANPMNSTVIKPTK